MNSKTVKNLAAICLGTGLIYFNNFNTLIAYADPIMEISLERSIMFVNTTCTAYPLELEYFQFKNYEGEPLSYKDALEVKLGDNLITIDPSICNNKPYRVEAIKIEETEAIMELFEE